MYIKCSTANPVMLSDEIINKIRQNHLRIISESKTFKKINTVDFLWRVTQPSKIEKWN
jgi:hypothetical protein